MEGATFTAAFIGFQDHGIDVLTLIPWLEICRSEVSGNNSRSGTQLGEKNTGCSRCFLQRLKG